MEEIYQAFERASRGKSGEEALQAMGEAYTGLIEDRDRLHADAAVLRRLRRRRVREAVRSLARPRRARGAGLGRAAGGRSARFFAKGMLLTVLIAMQLVEDPTPWGDRLLEGCRPESESLPLFSSAMKVTHLLVRKELR